jgi:hypothetical protein
VARLISLSWGPENPVKVITKNFVCTVKCIVNFYFHFFFYCSKAAREMTKMKLSQDSQVFVFELEVLKLLTEKVHLDRIWRPLNCGGHGAGTGVRGWGSDKLASSVFHFLFISTRH